MGLLLPESGLLFWMLLSFGVVFAVLAKYGFPVITRMVEERRAYVEQSLQAAQEANDQLAQVKAQSEALLQSAREQQMKILNEASATRDQIVAEAKAKAQAETQRQIDDAKRQIRLEQEAAVRADRTAGRGHRREGHPRETRHVDGADEHDRPPVGRSARHEGRTE